MMKIRGVFSVPFMEKFVELVQVKVIETIQALLELAKYSPDSTKENIKENICLIRLGGILKLRQI